MVMVMMLMVMVMMVMVSSFSWNVVAMGHCGLRICESEAKWCQESFEMSLPPSGGGSNGGKNSSKFLETSVFRRKWFELGRYGSICSENGSDRCRIEPGVFLDRSWLLKRPYLE